MSSMRQRNEVHDDVLKSAPSCLGIRTSLQGASRFFQTSASPSSSTDSSPKMVAIANPQFKRTQAIEPSENDLASWEPQRDTIENDCNSVSVAGPASNSPELQVLAGPLTKKCLPESSMVSRMWKLMKGLKPKLVKKLQLPSTSGTPTLPSTSASVVGRTSRSRASAARSAKLRKRGTRVGLRVSLLKIKHRFGVRRCGKLCEASTKCRATPRAPSYPGKYASYTSKGNDDLCVSPKTLPEHFDEEKAGEKDSFVRSQISNPEKHRIRSDYRQAAAGKDANDTGASLLELGGPGFQMPDMLPVGMLQSILSAEFGLVQSSTDQFTVRRHVHFSPPILQRPKIQSVPKWLHIYPSKNLVFQYLMKRKLFTCSITLENRTLKGVAFKFMTNSPFEYLVKPKQGLLSPGAKTSVRLVKARGAPSHRVASTYLSPFLSRRKKDMFVVATLPIQPTLAMPTNQCLPIDASIFDEHEDRCWYEGILTAVFPKLSLDVNEPGLLQDVVGANFWSFRRNLSLGPH